MGPLEDEDELYFLDIVTKSGSAGWIVGTKMSREWGIVQYREFLQHHLHDFKC